MKRECLIFFSFSLFIFHYSFLSAQRPNIDSLKTYLKTAPDDTNKVKALIAVGYWNKDTAMGMRQARKAYTLAQKLDWGEGMIEALHTEEVIANPSNNWTNDLIYFLKIIELGKRYNSTPGDMAKYYSGALNACYNLGEYPMVVVLSLEAIEIGVEHKDTNLIASYTYQLSVAYSRIDNITKSKEYFLKWMDIVRRKGNDRLLGFGYLKLGGFALEEGNKKEALEYSLKALDLYNKVKQSPRYFAELYCQLSGAYNQLGDYKQAFDYSQKCLEAGDTTKGTDIFVYPDYLLNSGEVYMNIDDKAKAVDAFETALKISVNIKNDGDIANALHHLSKLCMSQGDYEGASKYYSWLTQFDDSLHHIENSRKLDELITLNENDKEERQVVLKTESEKQTVILENTKRRNRIIVSFVAAVALAVAIIALLVFRSLTVTRKQKNIIEAQKTAVEEQKQVIEEKNKDIIDSITYAKRLQDAILPPISLIKEQFPESFVLYKPKDIVAGDFYWMWNEGDTVLIAACDCTGHGVPGAMVSVVCSNALNTAVKEFKLYEPGKILDKARELVIETFDKSSSEAPGEWIIRDGMDISLLSITRSHSGSHTISWAGANNPLWYVQGTELNEIKPDKQPIGKFDKQNPFRTHTLALAANKGTCLYLFSDGYADQFGGDKGKKFKYKQMQDALVSLQNLNMKQQGKKLNDIIENWKGSLQQVDDILIIGIRI